MTLLLSNEDVEAALSMPDCLEAMEIAYRDLGSMQGGNGIRSEVLTPTFRDDALYSLLTMSGVIPRFGIGAVRINSDILTWPVSPAGPRRVKVPAAPNGRYAGLVLLFSTHSGEPLAILPDGVVQRMRVGATSGLAAKYLARPDASEVALLGAGWQAGAQAMAICAVRSIERIRCYSPNRERREAFASEMQAKLGIEIVPSATAREAVSGADIVLCATNSMEPVLAAEWLEPGMHVSSLSRLELDEAWSPRPTWCSSMCATPIPKSSAPPAPIWRGIRSSEKPRSAARSVKRPVPNSPISCWAGCRAAVRIATSPCSSTMPGLGYQFAATGHVIYTKARELGLGRELDTDLFTSALPS